MFAIKACWPFMHCLLCIYLGLMLKEIATNYSMANLASGSDGIFLWWPMVMTNGRCYWPCNGEAWTTEEGYDVIRSVQCCNYIQGHTIWAAQMKLFTNYPKTECFDITPNGWQFVLWVYILGHEIDKTKGGTVCRYRDLKATGWLYTDLFYVDSVHDAIIMYSHHIACGQIDHLASNLSMLWCAIIWPSTDHKITHIAWKMSCQTPI